MTKTEQRATARKVLEAYKAIPGMDTGDDVTTLVDIIGDCLHLADVLEDEDGVRRGSEYVLDSATMHYEAELRFAPNEEQYA